MKRQILGIRIQRAIVAFLLFVAGLDSIVVHAQEQAPAQPPKSPEVLRLEEEKAQAVLRQQIAEARKAELAAKFPAPSSTPLSGGTTINDNAIIESNMIAYVSMAKAANRIIAAISKVNPVMKSLAIYNERDVTLLQAYSVTTAQLEALKKRFDDWIPPPETTPSKQQLQGVTSAALALPIAESFVGGLGDLTSFLRTNVDLKGTSFEIEEGPLVAEVFRAARTSNCLKDTSLFYPFAFAPDVTPTTKSVILARIEAVRNMRIKAAAILSDVAAKEQNLAKAAAKVDQMKGALELLSAKQKDTVAKTRQMLQAYCPQLCKAGRPTVVMPGAANQQDQEVETILKKIKMVESKCRTMSAEKRAELFEMRDSLKETMEAEAATKNKLRQADEDLNNRAKERALIAKKLKWPVGTLSETIQSKLANEQPILDNNEITETNQAIDNAVAFLKSACEQFDKFVTSIVQADAAIGVNPLTSYIRAEKLQEALYYPPKTVDSPQPANETPNSPTLATNGYWLQLKVLKAGGNNRIKTNLVVDVFTGGNRLSHSGGAIVQYFLYNSQGQVVASDTITEYIDYIKANKIKDLPCSLIDAGASNSKCLDQLNH